MSRKKNSKGLNYAILSYFFTIFKLGVISIGSYVGGIELKSYTDIFDHTNNSAFSFGWLILLIFTEIVALLLNGKAFICNVLDYRENRKANQSFVDCIWGFILTFLSLMCSVVGIFLTPIAKSVSYVVILIMMIFIWCIPTIHVIHIFFFY